MPTRARSASPRQATASIESAPVTGAPGCLGRQLPTAGEALRRASALGQLRQVSVRVTVPLEGTVAVRFAPDSQVATPDASFRMYLY